jgi:hypothetical protein
MAKKHNLVLEISHVNLKIFWLNFYKGASCSNKTEILC